jgi:hypothetical protein
MVSVVQRWPREVLRQVDDLADVIRGVRDRSVQRLDDEKGFPPDVDGPLEVLGLQGLDRRQRDREALVPRRQKVVPRRRRRHLEFAVAVPAGLFPVRGQKVGEARSQVSSDVLHDDGDAVGARVDERVEVLVRDLGERAVAEPLVLPEGARQIEQVGFLDTHVTNYPRSCLAMVCSCRFDVPS